VTRLSLDNQKLFGFVLLLALAPIWITTYLPMVDIPQHIAQVVTLQELWAGNPDFEEVFETKWFAPYTATYLVLFILALVMPVTIAAKVLVTIVVAAIPLVTGKLLREVGGYEPWKWFTIPCGYSVAFYWGFLPYMVAVPISLYLLLLTIRFANSPTLLKGLGIALATVILFFFHVLALGYIGLVSTSYLAVRFYKQPKKLALLWAPYTVGIPLIIYWLTSTHSAETTLQGAEIVFGPLLERLLITLSQSAGMGFYVIYPAIVIVIGFLAYPALTGATLSDKPERRALPIVGLLVMFLMPMAAFGAIYLFQRLTIFLLPLFLLAWDYPQARKPRWAPAVIAMVVFTALINIGRFTGFSIEMQSFKAILEVMEPEKNVLYMPVVPQTAGFRVPIHFHTGMLYQAEKRGIVDFSFAYFFASPVRYKEGQRDWFVDDRFVWNPMNFQWDKSNADYYDYFLVRSPRLFTEQLFREGHVNVELIATSDWWWLYKKKAADELRPPETD
jgi:hypothetical protein